MPRGHRSFEVRGEPPVCKQQHVVSLCEPLLPQRRACKAGAAGVEAIGPQWNLRSVHFEAIVAHHYVIARQSHQSFDEVGRRIGRRAEDDHVPTSRFPERYQLRIEQR